MTQSYCLLFLCLLFFHDIVAGFQVFPKREFNPEVFYVNFTVNLGRRKDEFIMEIRYAWAPLGAARFKQLIKSKFYDGTRFFRAMKSFMIQFGISGDPNVTAKWKDKRILDDPVLQVNTRGFVSYATSGKNTRTTQVFINTVDNVELDNMGFSPFGFIVEGMSVVDAIYTGYGDGGQGDGKDGKGPSQPRIEEEGNKYLKRYFPKLSYIMTAEIIDYAKKEERMKLEL